MTMAEDFKRLDPFYQYELASIFQEFASDWGMSIHSQLWRLFPQMDICQMDIEENWADFSSFDVFFELLDASDVFSREELETVCVILSEPDILPAEPESVKPLDSVGACLPFLNLLEKTNEVMLIWQAYLQREEQDNILMLSPEFAKWIREYKTKSGLGKAFTAYESEVPIQDIMA